MSKWFAVSFISALLASSTSWAYQMLLTVSGGVWQDNNGNGIVEPGEPVLSGIEVMLQNPFGGSTSVQTDSSGLFSFDLLNEGGAPLSPGNYHLIISDAFDKWVVTHPVKILGGVAGPIDVELIDVPVEVNIGLIPVNSLSRFEGTVTVNRKPVDSPDVTALIDGVPCSFPIGLRIPDGDTGRYSIAVASDGTLPGCGSNGDGIAFQVDGIVANESGAWFPRLTELNLTVGEPSEPVGSIEIATSEPHLGISPPNTGTAGLKLAE